MGDIMKNPKNVEKYAGDPEVMKVFSKVSLHAPGAMPKMPTASGMPGNPSDVPKPGGMPKPEDIDIAALGPLSNHAEGFFPGLYSAAAIMFALVALGRFCKFLTPARGLQIRPACGVVEPLICM